MIIVITTRKGKVFEVANIDNYSKALDKLNWLIKHLEDLGYMLIKETSNTFEFSDKKVYSYEFKHKERGWRYGVMFAHGYANTVDVE